MKLKTVAGQVNGPLSISKNATEQDREHGGDSAFASQDNGLEAPHSSKKRRLSMEVPSAKKQINDGKKFGNKPLFEQFRR